MAEILLTSEARVKDYIDISDNTAGKFINIAIRTAQRMHYRQIIGSALFDKLCALVANNTIGQPANATYKALLDESQDYLCWRTGAELLNLLPVKVGNIGAVKATDENLQTATREEIISKQNYYESNADFCCKELQGWILDHRTALPELNENDCHKIESTLYSSATCGVWLGGARGKALRPARRGCRK